MNEAPEDLHHRLDQLRLLATETSDPLAERLVRDMIAELEDQLADDEGRARVLPLGERWPAGDVQTVLAATKRRQRQTSR